MRDVYKEEIRRFMDYRTIWLGKENDAVRERLTFHERVAAMGEDDIRQLTAIIFLDAFPLYI